LGGYDRISQKFSFSGELLLSLHEHNDGTNTTQLVKIYEYDHRGRLLKTTVDIVGKTKATMSVNQYNRVGQLTTKYLHLEENGYALQRTDYEYNVRGWLTDINKVGYSNKDAFAMHLDYEKSDRYKITPNYNGNISAISWSRPFVTEQNYLYTYDNVNRLTNAECFKYNLPTFAEKIRYYGASRINSLERKGVRNSPYPHWDVIDDLGYQYNDGHLSKVKDYSKAEEGFRDTSVYSYDNNGNMTSCNDYDVFYNHLNLPKGIKIKSKTALYRKASSSSGSGSGGGELGGEPVYNYTYTYTATGEKLQKTQILGNGMPLSTTYIGQFVYENERLSYIITEEGMILHNADDTYTHTYHLRDHLGNTRVVIDQNQNILQSNDYYPYGMPHQAPTGNNRYLYNGKELQPETGLLDYGARSYNPVLGLFTTIDRFAEKYYSMNPYGYCAGNPVKFIDVNGDSTLYYSDNKLLFIANDQKIGNVVVDIPTKNKEKFVYSILSIASIGGDLNTDEINSTLRGLGTQYNLDAIKDFDDEYAHDPMGGGLNANKERGVNLYEENGVVAPGGKVYDGDGNSVKSNTIGFYGKNSGTEIGFMHLHSSTYVNNDMNPAPSDPDYKDKSEMISQYHGKYNLVVSASHIYFISNSNYGSKYSGFGIPRNNTLVLYKSVWVAQKGFINEKSSLAVKM